MIDKNKIPIDAIEVLNILKQNGYSAYLVGGCVRDLCLGKEPKDYDICTSAIPEKVMNIFKPTHNVIETGLKHGTITLIADHLYIKNALRIPIEVTTFRSDGDYSNGRRPDSVKFGVTVQEDVSRRDFTINGLLYDSEKVIDYVGGLKDLKNKTICAVGDPWDRYQDDHLRMMRCIRFACQLNFNIEEYTFLAIKYKCSLIKNISQERIKDELCKILLSDRPAEGIQLLEKSGLLQYILPELQECVGFDQHNYHHRKNVFDHILKVLDATPCSLNLRLASLLHDIGKPKTFTIDENNIGHFYSHHIVGFDMSEEILKRLKFDNNTIDNVRILVREHMSRYPKLRTNSIKKLINRVGKNNIDDLINLQIADIIGSKPPYEFEDIINLKKEIQRVLDAKEPLSVKDLAINGHDLMSVGIQPGKRMGEILNELVEIVLKDPELNIKEKLLEIVKNDFQKPL